MSDDIDPTSVVIHNTSITTAMPTVIISNDNTSIVAFNTTAATTPTEPSRGIHGYRLLCELYTHMYICMDGSRACWEGGQ